MKDLQRRMLSDAFGIPEPLEKEAFFASLQEQKRKSIKPILLRAASAAAAFAAMFTIWLYGRSTSDYVNTPPENDNVISYTEQQNTTESASDHNDKNTSTATDKDKSNDSTTTGDQRSELRTTASAVTEENVQQTSAAATVTSPENKRDSRLDIHPPEIVTSDDNPPYPVTSCVTPTSEYSVTTAADHIPVQTTTARYDPIVAATTTSVKREDIILPTEKKESGDSPIMEEPPAYFPTEDPPFSERGEESETGALSNCVHFSKGDCVLRYSEMTGEGITQPFLDTDKTIPATWKNLTLGSSDIFIAEVKEVIYTADTFRTPHTIENIKILDTIKGSTSPGSMAAVDRIGGYIPISMMDGYTIDYYISNYSDSGCENYFSSDRFTRNSKYTFMDDRYTTSAPEVGDICLFFTHDCIINFTDHSHKVYSYTDASDGCRFIKITDDEYTSQRYSSFPGFTLKLQELETFLADPNKYFIN